jgi:HEAT repeat protein
VGKPDYARALERRLDDGFDLVRLNAVEALGALGDRESLELLDRLSTEPASASDDPEASERFRVYMQSATETLRARVG